MGSLPDPVEKQTVRLLAQHFESTAAYLQIMKIADFLDLHSECSMDQQ